MFVKLLGYFFVFSCLVSGTVLLSITNEVGHSPATLTFLLGFVILWAILPKGTKSNLRNKIRGVKDNVTDRAVSEILSRKNGNNHPYPELIPFEVKIDRAIAEKKNLNIDLTEIGLTQEKWEYLKKKYNQLELPITHRFNENHEVYKSLYERLKPSILEGKTVSLGKYTAETIQKFVDLDIPGKPLLFIEPLNLKFLVSGLKYHDYKKKEVKIMLESTDFEDLILEREPSNEFDYYATKILWKDYLLGYVPREYSKEVADLLDKGKNWSANVYDYKDYGKVAERLEVEIEIERI